MSKRSEKLYKEISDIRDEYIEEADKNEKGKNISDNLEVESQSDTIQLDNINNSSRSLLYAAAILVVIVLAGLLVKAKVFDNEKKIADTPEETLVPTKKPIVPTKKPVEDDVKEDNKNLHTLNENKIDTDELTNNYKYLLEANSKYVIDIDGDGQEDEIIYLANNNTEETTHYLYINGTMNIVDTDNSSSNVYIIDLNKEDNAYEFFVNGKLLRWINSYKNFDVLYEGDSNIENYNFNNSSSGSCSVKETLEWNVGYCSFWSDYKYDVVEEEIETPAGIKVVSECAFMYQPNEYEVIDVSGFKLKSEINIYLEHNKDSEKMLIQPQNLIVKKLFIDEEDIALIYNQSGSEEFSKIEANKYLLENGKKYANNWLLVECEDGTTGWLAIEGNSEEVIGEVEEGIFLLTDYFELLEGGDGNE